MRVNSDIAGGIEQVRPRLTRSRELLSWLAGELACWFPGPECWSPAEGVPADIGPVALSTTEGVSRLTLQMSRLCELVKLSVDQVANHGDMGLGWVLLEQARQQLGHAANVASDVTAGGDGAGPEGVEGVEGAEDFDRERYAVGDLLWLLQRDLSPWSDDASVAVEFGSGPDMLPDFRPDTPLEFGPLQLLAHATMTGIAGEAIADSDDTVMRMAFGEYAGRILTEAMELLDVAAGRSGSLLLSTLTETGWEVRALLSGAFPLAEEIFSGPAGFPESEDD